MSDRVRLGQGGTHPLTLKLRRAFVGKGSGGRRLVEGRVSELRDGAITIHLGKRGGEHGLERQRECESG